MWQWPGTILQPLCFWWYPGVALALAVPPTYYTWSGDVVMLLCHGDKLALPGCYSVFGGALVQFLNAALFSVVPSCAPACGGARALVECDSLSCCSGSASALLVASARVPHCCCGPGLALVLTLLFWVSALVLLCLAVFSCCSGSGCDVKLCLGTSLS